MRSQYRLGNDQIKPEQVLELQPTHLIIGSGNCTPSEAGVSTEVLRRYSPLVMVGIFLACGAAGIYVATLVETFPLALGGNAAALGLLCAWLVRDRKASTGARGDLAWVARAEAPADEPRDGLAQRLMGIPGDRDRLRVEIIGKVDGGPHTVILPSVHHDALMRKILSSLIACRR